MDLVYYFAYGSNLHPPRLTARVPSAQLIGLARLRGHRLTFHKRGGDASGKCNVFATGRHQDIVHGAVFVMHRREMPILDRIEGVGHGYYRIGRMLSVAGRLRRVFFYVAQPDYIAEDLPPFDWYHTLVLTGARNHGFPRRYLDEIAAVATQQDRDRRRTLIHKRLLRHRGPIKPPWQR